MKWTKKGQVWTETSGDFELRLEECDAWAIYQLGVRLVGGYDKAADAKRFIREYLVEVAS